ncbi:MAG: LPS export ABC transporter periplasmic protein LptC [Acidobacteriota bacterium]|nr:LPS export ABC transporter periplasmic protein LptC [Acidobacteriota bacterium]
MARWQKRLRFVFLLVVVAVPIAVALAIHRRAVPPPSAVQAPHVEPNAVVESTAGVVTQVKGSRETFKVAYQRQLTFADGSTKLVGVTVTVDDRGGRSFMVTGTNATVGDHQSSVTLTGHVRMAVSDGLRAQTEQAVYTQGDGMVRVPGPVTFSRGAMSGSSVGLTYDKNNDILSLAKDAIIDIAPDSPGGQPTHLAAGSAEYVRHDHMLVFQGHVQLQREGRTVEADSGTAYLTPDDKALSRLSLRGGSQITGGPGGAGSVAGLHATDMDLAYRDPGGTLQQATLMGGAAVDIAGARRGEDRRVAADQLNIGLAADGTTVSALTGQGGVALTFPAENGEPARTIRADALGATGQGTQGVTSAVMTGHVDYRERIAGGDRIAKAERLDLGLTPGLGAVQRARFSGDVRFAQGAMEAEAAVGDYDVTAGVVKLSGQGPGGAEPHVTDPRIMVDATAIALAPTGPKLQASGNVRSVLLAGADHGTAAKDGGHLPAILKQDQPVNITGDDLAYDGTTAHAVYTGHARLWQGDTAIEGATITLDREEGNLSASGGVRTTMRVDQVDEKTKKKERVTLLGLAAQMTYNDAARLATYTEDPRLNGPQGDLTATKKIELYLSADGSTVQRLEGFEGIVLRQAGRTVTGEHLSYFAADERYVVTGAPVKIDEECRQTLGKTLTFFRSTDRIIVDGGGAYRTETKSGPNCSGPRGE